MLDSLLTVAITEYQLENDRRQALVARVNSYLTVISLVITASIVFASYVLSVIADAKPACSCPRYVLYIGLIIVLALSVVTMLLCLGRQKGILFAALPLDRLWNGKTIAKEIDGDELPENAKKTVVDITDSYLSYADINSKENDKLSKQVDIIYRFFSATVIAFSVYIGVLLVLLGAYFGKI